MDDRGQDDDESPSAEDQYQIVSICTFGVARLNKKLQKHFSGEKVMTKKDLEATFVEIDELMQGCREHVLREYVHLDSDIVESIDHETVTNLEDDDEESDGDETSPPPASPTSKKKGTAKGRPGPKGKGKGSTTTLNEQVSGCMLYHHGCCFPSHIYTLLTFFVYLDLSLSQRRVAPRRMMTRRKALFRFPTRRKRMAMTDLLKNS